MFSVKRFPNGESETLYRKGIGFTGLFLDSDLHFQGLGIGPSLKRRKRVTFSCRCSHCGFEFEQVDDVGADG